MMIMIQCARCGAVCTDPKDKNRFARRHPDKCKAHDERKAVGVQLAQKTKAVDADEDCGFGLAWVGNCKQPATAENGRCQTHTKEVCSSCGAPATHECEETGQLVCGFPLCDNCVHAIAPDGTNGGVGFYSSIPDDMQKTWKTHVKKTEQSYKPWYAREKSAGEAAVSMAIAGAIRLGIL